MSQLRTVQRTITALPKCSLAPLPTPAYTGPKEDDRARVGMAVESMKHHMSNEGWEIFLSLQHEGYILAGYQLPFNSCDTRDILSHLKPGVVVLQDEREWDVQPRDFREPRAKFINTGLLSASPDIFKLTIVKDCQHNPSYHSASASRIGCHAWVTYYHTDIALHLASYMRREHIIRTYHTVDREIVPQFIPEKERRGTLLSGAVSGAYPLRSRLVKGLANLHQTTYLPHPGYHRRGTHTPEFLKMLSRFKIAICTSSIYGYALRKIIEATACGCVVVTDLPFDEVLPAIDGNLFRIPSDMTPVQMGQLLKDLSEKYDEERQRYYSQMAIGYYDYRHMGAKLASDIEEMRGRYANSTEPDNRGHLPTPT